MTITIRTASSTDIPALRELIDASVRGLSNDHYTTEQVEAALVEIFGVDSQLIVDGTYFVAEIDNQLAGSGGWSKRKTLFGGDQSKGASPDDLLNPETDAARIRAFYVHPMWSRRGVGAKLISVCEAAARNAGFRRIELVATLPGVPLYSANGYQKVKDAPIEIAGAPPLGAFLMAKDL